LGSLFETKLFELTTKLGVEFFHGVQRFRNGIDSSKYFDHVTIISAD